MSRLRFLRSLVFLAVFITPALSGHPQKQNADERTTPSLPARYPAAAPANMGQRVSLPGARFDPRSGCMRREHQRRRLPLWPMRWPPRV